MFQLEERLRDWSDQFSRNESMGKEEIEELEAHLRDAMLELKAKGLNDREAFTIATQRLGEPDSIHREFRKVNGHFVWARRAFWMATGCLLMKLLHILITAIATLCQASATLAGANGTVSGLVTLATYVACWVFIAIWFRRSMNNEQFSFARGFLNLNGAVIGTCVVLTILIAMLVQAGGHVVIARVTPVEEFGRAALILARANALLAVLVPTVLLIIAVKLHRAIWIPVDQSAR